VEYIFIIRRSVIQNFEAATTLRHSVVTGGLFLIEVIVMLRNTAAENISEVRIFQ